MQTYEQFSNLLQMIETDNVKSIEDIAGKLFISASHLKHMFKFVFGKPLGTYIRSRLLARSMYDLLDSNNNILDIAYKYGFEFEQSYIRAFKKEFEITPGDFRMRGKILQITPPLSLPENSLTDGILFEPDFVMLSDIYLVGKRYQIPFKEAEELAPKVGLEFYNTKRYEIKNRLQPEIYYGLTNTINVKDQCSDYIPSVQVHMPCEVPNGYDMNRVPHSLYIRFKYLGNHSYHELNAKIADEMYQKINHFITMQKKYQINEDYYFERIDVAHCKDDYCEMEWYTPVKIIQNVHQTT